MIHGCPNCAPGLPCEGCRLPDACPVCGARWSCAHDEIVERLRESLRSGLLLDRWDEPLDAYGQRVVRVVIAALESARASDARPTDLESGKAIGSAEKRNSQPSRSPMRRTETEKDDTR